MVVARSIKDSTFLDHLREAAAQAALTLCGWKTKSLASTAMR